MSGNGGTNPSMSQHRGSNPAGSSNMASGPGNAPSDASPAVGPPPDDGLDYFTATTSEPDLDAIPQPTMQTSMRANSGNYQPEGDMDSNPPFGFSPPQPPYFADFDSNHEPTFQIALPHTPVTYPPHMRPYDIDRQLDINARSRDRRPVPGANTNCNRVGLAMEAESSAQPPNFNAYFAPQYYDPNTQHADAAIQRYRLHHPPAPNPPPSSNGSPTTSEAPSRPTAGLQSVNINISHRPPLAGMMQPYFSSRRRLFPPIGDSTTSVGTSPPGMASRVHGRRRSRRSDDSTTQTRQSLRENHRHAAHRHAPIVPTTGGAVPTNHPTSSDNPFMEAHFARLMYAGALDYPDDANFAMYPPDPASRRRLFERMADHGRVQQPQPKGLDNQNDGRPEPKESAELTVNLECKACMSQLIDTAVLPCGHAVLCRWCAEQHAPSSTLDKTKLRPGALCPMCREPVRQKIRIYLS
ncbi:hypothetical protein FQN55_000288 [Onygenales sp. PD_40]|nr:hypothetical protein FQN55_000288 [Onygenales sp. PD_40]KAK2801476.1 hypothetical protein FQN51_005370 [Onygenales sp. PD_10]